MVALHFFAESNISSIVCLTAVAFSCKRDEEGTILMLVILFVCVASSFATIAILLLVHYECRIGVFYSLRVRISLPSGGQGQGSDIFARSTRVE
jgi:hypothetical protein